jgi:GR25 family glycosyltransferase involved in LPS biosynthesis
MDNFNIYLLNLEKDTERLKLAKKELSNYKNVTYFKAINGNKIDIKQYFDDNNLDYKSKLLDFPKGAVGCFLSHMAIWKSFLNSNYKYALILEDDIKINYNLQTAFSKIETFNEKWDIVYLYLNQFVFAPLPYLNGSFLDLKNNFKIPIQPLGTIAYIIKKNTVKKLLDFDGKICTTVDQFLANLHIKGKINSFYLDYENKPYIDLNIYSQYSNTSERKYIPRQLVFKKKIPFFYKNIRKYKKLSIKINTLYIFLNRIYFKYFKYEIFWKIHDFLLNKSGKIIVTKKKIIFFKKIISHVIIFNKKINDYTFE